MKALKNDEPAFPSAGLVTPDGVAFEGMTLRDYFAAKAMQVILKDQYEDGLYVGDKDNDSEDVCATSAYIMADAMLKARDK